MSKAAEVRDAHCNFYVTGVCKLLTCMERGARAARRKHWLHDPFLSSCVYREAVVEIEQARELIRSMVENDPNDYAADAVTVLDVWRKDAAEFLERSK